MEETSLIDFLKMEVSCFRELLSSLVAEERAYQEAAYSKIFEINSLQKQILDELKLGREKKFKPFNPQDDVDSSLLHNLKDQLDTLVDKLHCQKERNLFVKTFTPQMQPQAAPLRKLKTEVCEDEC